LTETKLVNIFGVYIKSLISVSCSQGYSRNIPSLRWTPKEIGDESNRLKSIQTCEISSPVQVFSSLRAKSKAKY